MKGGARPGAGRPSLPEGRKRRMMKICVAPETVARINFLRCKGVAIGRLVDEMIREKCGEFGK